MSTRATHVCALHFWSLVRRESLTRLWNYLLTPKCGILHTEKHPNLPLQYCKLRHNSSTGSHPLPNYYVYSSSDPIVGFGSRLLERSRAYTLFFLSFHFLAFFIFRVTDVNRFAGIFPSFAINCLTRCAPNNNCDGSISRHAVKQMNAQAHVKLWCY